MNSTISVKPWDTQGFTSSTTVAGRGRNCTERRIPADLPAPLVQDAGQAHGFVEP